MAYKLNPSFREFLMALDFILYWEGGYTFNESDYGGMTNRGITQSSYDNFCNRTNRTSKSVNDLSEVDVIDFYWLDRFIPSYADKLPYPLALVMFDNSVLFSVGGAFSFVNEFLYDDSEDYSTRGIEALLTRPKDDPYFIEIALGICDCREKEHRRVVKNDESQEVFIDGWLNRLNHLREVINQYTSRKEPLWRYRTLTSRPS